MKKIYLIHGWGGNPNSEAWFSWLRNECRKRDIQLTIPGMPDTDNPKIEEWLEKAREVIKPDEETYLIGHSMGAQLILRYLEQLPAEVKINGCIFVAGFFNLLETTYECPADVGIARPWIEKPIDLKKVRLHTDDFLAIFSRTDPCVPVSDSEIFKEKLGAEIIIKDDEGHFNETKEIKEIMGFIER